MTTLIAQDLRVEFPVYGSQRNIRKALFEHAVGGLIRRTGRHDRVIVNALQGVSLELHEGDRVGLIGPNGAGKSTLLRALAGVYQPVSGRVLIDGRITPLFDAMPGLDPEDIGYENIITAGLLLGLKRDEIENKIREIEQFSELGEYLSLPVRTYSAGMLMRLAFSVATALEPDILLMDEGMAVADSRFAERAARRMHEFMGRSKILILASHSPELLRAACNKGALMIEGRILATGSISDILEKYELAVHGTPCSFAQANTHL